MVQNILGNFPIMLFFLEMMHHGSGPEKLFISCVQKTKPDIMSGTKSIENLNYINFFNKKHK